MKMRTFLVLACISAFGIAVADDLLGDTRGGGSSGGGSSSGGSSGGGGSSSGGSSGGGSNSGGNVGSSGSRGNSGGSNSGNRDRDERENRGSTRSSDDGFTRVESTGQRRGRSGPVNYRSDSNRYDGRTRSSEWNYEIPVRKSVWEQARNEDRARQARRYRDGYYSHNDRWRDNDFWYGHYRFTYDSRSCVISPFYRFPQSPGYISTSRARYDRPIDLGRFDELDFDKRWKPSRRDWDWQIYDAMDDITRVFTKRDTRRLGEILPDRRRVGIYSPNGDYYTLGSEDVYDMLRDLVEGSRTRAFEVYRIEYNRNYARMEADYTFWDPWNRSTTQTLIFTFKSGSRNMELVEFETRD